MTDKEIIKDDIAALTEERSGYVGILIALFGKVNECQMEINRRITEARQKGVKV